MSAIKEKVAKLLALSNSSNEKEAQAALLKARELMARHKLRPEECQENADAKVVVKTIGVECTKMTDTWAVALGGIIGKRYCCKVFRSHAHGAKKVTVGFAGLEDDFDVCRRIYLYAYHCIKDRCGHIQARERNSCRGKELREMCNAYGWGFCYGLEATFQEQEQKHQEWGLVLAVPQAVEDAMSHMGKPTLYGKANTDGWRAKYVNAGYAEGKKFVPDRQLESMDKQYGFQPERERRITIMSYLNDRTLVKVSADEYCIGFKTVSRRRKSRRKFLVTREEFARLEHKHEIISRDIYSFADLRRDTAAGTLSISFSWLHGGRTDGQLTGWEETVVLPYEALAAFVRESAQENGPEEWRCLSVCNTSRPRLAFHDHERLRECVKNRAVRKKLSHGLRDNFNYPHVDQIDFYHDFEPYSFMFREVRNGQADVVGGFIFHNHDNDLKKGYYSVHT